MKLVKEILETKDSQIWSIQPEATVYAAIEQMADKEVGALLVLEADKLVGVVTERDYVHKVALKAKPPQATLVREIMTSPVIYVSPDDTLEKCMALMTLRRVRHLPVLDGGQLVGIISMRDLVKAIIAKQASLIQQLERYIIKHTTT